MRSRSSKHQRKGWESLSLAMKIAFSASVAVLVVAVCALAISVVFSSEISASVSGSEVRQTRPMIRVEGKGLDLSSERPRVSINGKIVAGDFRIESPARVFFRPRKKLEEGNHMLRVMHKASGASSDVVKFAVDTTPPSLNFRLTSGVVRKDKIRITVSTERGARVSVKSPKTSEMVLAPNGRASASISLKQGPQAVTVSATDRAGNRRTRVRKIFVDSFKPALHVGIPIKGETPELRGKIRATDGAGVNVSVTVNGVTDGFSVQPRGKRTWRVLGESPMAQGNNRVIVKAVDGHGNATIWNRNVFVDTTEVLDGSSLRRGARGNDVRQLHKALRSKGLFKTSLARKEWRQKRYGKYTERSVGGFQNARGIVRDGIAGDETLAALTLRIEINRASHSLTLYRIDTAVETFPVAVGSSRYPTPTGEFTIVNMQMNPTWNPPDSDWAKNAKPIPPGPDNPLGTRWMGLSVPNVGIHGTNNPASLGYSVSHGCIRMAIPDVERLFEIVQVGTPVVIV